MGAPHGNKNAAGPHKAHKRGKRQIIRQKTIRAERRPLLQQGNFSLI